MTARQAAAAVKAELKRRGLGYTKVTGMTVDFTDLARASLVSVTVYGWKPDPVAHEIVDFGRKNKFSVDFVVLQGAIAQEESC